MSREKSEKVCITFRLSEEEHEKLKQYSSACGLSTAEFMRQLCRGNAPQPQPEKEFWELLAVPEDRRVYRLARLPELQARRSNARTMPRNRLKTCEGNVGRQVPDNRCHPP